MSVLFLPEPRLGSAHWLVRHELRLAWRGTAQKGRRLLAVLMGVASLILHIGAYTLLHRLPDGEMPPQFIYLLGGAVWLCLSLMLSQAILQSVSALFDRGDLDLLLSSPLPTQSVFVARGLGIAVSVLTLYLFLLAPLANAGLLTGHANLLAIYLALPALALAVTALGLWLTLSLVRVLGARRARTVAQVFGSLVGASLFLITQGNSWVGEATRQHWAGLLRHWAEPGGALAIGSPVWWPARALQGELLPLLAMLALGAGSFWLVVRLAHRRFLEGTQESVSGSARRGMKAPPAGTARFRRGLWRNVLVKEWRMILRDPQLIAQSLLQVLYLVPAVWLPLHGGGGGSAGNPALLATAVVGLATTLASALTWITVSAEDAPELLGSSPNSPAQLRWLKVAAALIPVWLLVSPALIPAVREGLWPALVFVFCLAGGTLSVGAAQVWYPRQGKRGDLKKRGQGAQAVGILELLIAAGWAATAYCLNAALPYAPLALAAALAGSGAVWLMGRARREEGTA